MEISPVEEVVPYASRFTWTIENFSSIYEHKESEVFVVGGYPWQLLLYPNVNFLEIYLAVADSFDLPLGWRRKAQFSLTIVDQLHQTNTIKRIAPPVVFSAQKKKAGFKKIVRLWELGDENLGFIVNDRCVIEAEVEVHKGLVDWSYDSKKETSFVGLKNQGATCYMNSLLQTLYNIPYFRKAVYGMPITEDGGMPLALQMLFYKLQHKGSSVGTKALTKSFGWTSVDSSFMQHDVQELNRVLCERLEEKMKGTVVEGTIQNLFEGHHMNYIECIDVDYKSTRKESFCDIQLDVKGCRDVYASFDKYVEVECMEGDNKYQAEQHGLQDAKKGVTFVDFPPVLQLQLKRFEYDYTEDAMVKINDKYEFPLTLDLDRDNRKYLSPDSDTSVRNLYTLHSVLVHSGGVSGGHYYAYIRPNLTDQWFKFDDDEVTKEDRKMAVEENYGGHTFFGFTKFSSAYMLVYIRDSDKDKILCDVDENDITEDLPMRLQKKKEEKMQKKRERAEALLYTTIKVARDKDLFEQIGRDIFFDIVDHDKVHNFRVEKRMLFKDFKELVAREFGVPVELLRFWQWVKRENHTYRPSMPMTYQEELKSVGDLGKEVMKLFVEEGFGVSLPKKAEDDILLFFKLYDPITKQLRYVGRLFVKSLIGRPIEILPKLKEMAGFSPDEEIDLYEEINFKPTILCTPIKKNMTFHSSKLEDGDIVCFQRSLTAEARKAFSHPDVPSFFKYVRNRKVVKFQSLVNPEKDNICLELSMTFTYDEVMEKLASHLSLDDPTKIRLASPGSSSPIKYRGFNKLSDMLQCNRKDAFSDTLTFEILDVSLPELEDLKTVELDVILNQNKKRPRCDMSVKICC
ncbi:ubiquitinyl hydrolase 1 [Ranunculus cassubicifolius]